MTKAIKRAMRGRDRAIKKRENTHPESIKVQRRCKLRRRESLSRFTFSQFSLFSASPVYISRAEALAYLPAIVLVLESIYLYIYIYIYTRAFPLRDPLPHKGRGI